MFLCISVVSVASSFLLLILLILVLSLFSWRFWLKIYKFCLSPQKSSFYFIAIVQSLSRVQLFETLWTLARQGSLSFTISQSLLKLYPLSQWCHPTISYSVTPFSFWLSQRQGHYQWVSSVYQVAKVLELQLQHQSFLWIFRVDFL